jgi:hypothetical protein
MPKLVEVVGGTETKIYFQASISCTCALAVPRILKAGLRLKIKEKQ